MLMVYKAVRQVVCCLLRIGRQTGRVDDNINAVAARMTFFKDKTLPTIKHFDDLGKLCIVSCFKFKNVIYYKKL